MLFLQRFSCSSAAGAEVALQMARWQSTSLRPKRGGAARSGLHLPPRTQNPSFSLLTHHFKVIQTHPGLPLNRPFSDPWPPIRCTRSEARTLAPPGSGLCSNLSRLTGEKTFLYSKLADARVTQNAPTPGQLRMPTHRNPAHAVAIGCVWLQRRSRTKWINFTVKTQQKARQRKYVQSEVVWKKKKAKKPRKNLFHYFDVWRAVLSSSSRATLVLEDLAHLQPRLPQITAMLSVPWSFSSLIWFK